MPASDPSDTNKIPNLRPVAELLEEDLQKALSQYAGNFDQSEESGIPKNLVNSQLELCGAIFSQGWRTGISRMLDDVRKINSFCAARRKRIVRAYGIIAWFLFLLSLAVRYRWPDLTHFSDATLAASLFTLGMLFSYDMSKV